MNNFDFEERDKSILSQEEKIDRKIQGFLTESEYHDFIYTMKKESEEISVPLSVSVYLRKIVKEFLKDRKER